MAGYSGYSMSNNAVAAYENGEKPLRLILLLVSGNIISVK